MIESEDQKKNEHEKVKELKSSDWSPESFNKDIAALRKKQKEDAVGCWKNPKNG
ncbi:MAG: hypothetical protein V3R78_12470 [Thermodesulfobacteriota bacterium]